MNARALHFVFKIAHRAKTYEFYTNVLKMKVLRHEEFKEGCKATCNGPYDGAWSKTMIGYGSEDDHFVLELTYNYEVHKYEIGNDFRGLIIDNDKLFEDAKKMDHRELPCGRVAIKDPEGREVKIGPGMGKLKINRVQLHVTDLQKSRDYWQKTLGMSVVEETETRSIFRFGEKQAQLEIVKLDGQLNRGTGYGRIAFSCPTDQLAPLQEKIKKENHKIINELMTLPTPGKSDVHVVILADPDGHEICFVGDEAFRELSKVDEKSDEELKKAMKNDDSEKWYK